jgi:hypothetical protein
MATYTIPGPGGLISLDTTVDTLVGVAPNRVAENTGNGSRIERLYRTAAGVHYLEVSVANRAGPGNLSLDAGVFVQGPLDGLAVITFRERNNCQ